MSDVGNTAPTSLLSQDEKQIRSGLRRQMAGPRSDPKDNTPGCTEEAEDFTAAVRPEKKGAAVVGVIPTARSRTAKSWTSTRWALIS